MSNFKINIHTSPFSFKGIQEIDVCVTPEGSTSGHYFSVLDGAQLPWNDDKFKSHFSGIDPDFLSELECTLLEFFKNSKHDRVQQTFDSKKSETEVADMMKMMHPRTRLCFESVNNLVQAREAIERAYYLGKDGRPQVKLDIPENDSHFYENILKLWNALTQLIEKLISQEESPLPTGIAQKVIEASRNPLKFQETSEKASVDEEDSTFTAEEALQIRNTRDKRRGAFFNETTGTRTAPVEPAAFSQSL